MTADPVASDLHARPVRVGGRGGVTAVAAVRRPASAPLSALLLAAWLLAVPAGLALAAAAAGDSTLALPDAAAAAPTDSSLTTAVPTAATTPKAAAPAEPTVDLWDTGVDATRAVLVTPLFPGWGQLYADGGWRAALAFGVEMYFWSNLLARDRQARRDLDYADALPDGDLREAYARSLAVEHHEQVKDFAWWSGGALLIIALDAYVGAHLFDFGHDPVTVPNRWEDAFGPVAALPGGRDGGPQVTVFQWRTGF